MRVSVVATGIDAQAESQPRPVLKVYSQPQKLVRAKETEIPAQETTALPATAEAADEPIAERRRPRSRHPSRGTPAEPSKSAVETPCSRKPVEKPATETVIEAEQPAKLGV